MRQICGIIFEFQNNFISKNRNSFTEQPFSQDLTVKYVGIFKNY